MSIDPFTLEVVQEGLLSVVREMRTNLIRTAYSSVIYEGHDFSCALMNGRGQLVAQGEDNPSHLFPIRWSVRLMLDQFQGRIRPGDIFIHNDPYTGGTHLNDVAILYPVLSQEGMVAFPALRAHWGDVGGMTPGSLSGKATEIYQEGVRIPLLKLYEEGRVNEAVLTLLLANVRAPQEREGDLRAMIGACRIAQERLEAMMERLGPAPVAEGVDRLLARAEERMRQRIARLPRGRYPYECYLESTGTSAEPVRIQVELRVKEEGLEVDFAGTSPQVAGPMNSGPAVAPTAVFSVIKSFLDPKGPVNDGVIAPVTIHTPEGTVVNATFPTPCGGFAEVRRACESAVMGALAQVIPGEVTGDMKGTANHCYISGWDQGRGRAFIFYEYPAGGTGASPSGDGNNVCRTFMEGDFSTLQPVEAVEVTFPLRIERCQLRPDSGGDGRHRGGLGLRREVRLLGEGGLLSVLSDKNLIPPFGVMGGWSGACNAFTVLRKGVEIQPSPVPGKVSAFPLLRDDVVVIQTSGGGGYGDPLARDPAQVLSEVEQGYVSPQRARARYGLDVEGSQPLSRAAPQARRALAEPPVLLRVGKRRGPERPRSRRMAVMHPSTAESLGVAEGGLVEVVNPKGAPLRAWVECSSQAREGWVLLSESGLRMLQQPLGRRASLRVRPLLATG